VRAHIRVAVKVSRSRIAGKGLFAQAIIRRRQKLGEMTGEIIRQREVASRIRGKRRIVMVELDHGEALDASRGNALKYVNHSCAPNTYIRIFGKRVEFYALRAIRRDEELTCNYGETHHEGKLRCRCGSAGCQGFI
jgi:SET domain-containing protein